MPADFTFSREETEEVLNYDVLITQFENMSEQRRLRSANELIGFKIKTPIRTKTQMQAIRSFYKSKKGPLTAFTFTSPYDDVTYNVRFVGELRTPFQSGVFYCQMELKILGVAS